MIKKLTYLGLLLSSLSLLAQEEEKQNKGIFNIGIESNSQWYKDIKPPNKDTDKLFRSNNYIKGDYYINKWEFGMQLESYSPKALLNYAPALDKTEVGAVYARYNNPDIGLDVTAGHFYEQFGSGLILRSWEDRQLGINNALFGGRVGYAFLPGAKVTVLGGKQRIGMGFDLSDSFISGANVDMNIAELAALEEIDLNIGASYVGRYENLQEKYSDLDKMTNMYSVRADMSKGGFYAGAEYVYKSKDALVEGGGAVQTIFDDKLYDGNALLLNFGYSQSGFGLDVNLRRVQNIGMYSERGLQGNKFNTGVVNYVPSLTKQYDFALQNIYVYQVQSTTSFDPLLKPGEIGGQFDLFYQFKRNTSMGGKYGTYLAVNGSFWNALDYKNLNMGEKEVSSGFLDFGRKYYNDLALEVRKKLSSQWQSIFMVMGQYYNQKYIEGKNNEVKSYIAGADLIYKFGDAQSLRFIGQHLWTRQDKKNWASATLEYAPSLKWSFYTHDLYNYGGDNKHYYSLGGAYVVGATRIGMSYGRQREGLICVGGVCRLVPESSGLTINISTNF